MKHIPEPLRSILNTYCHVEWAEQMNSLSTDVNKKDWFYNVKLFKEQLRDAIYHPNFSLKEYEKITNEDFDTKEDLILRLREVWDYSFPGEPL